MAGLAFVGSNFIIVDCMAEEAYLLTFSQNCLRSYFRHRLLALPLPWRWSRQYGVMCVVAGTDHFGSAASVHPILNILSASLASPPPRIERKPMADGWTWRPAMTLSRRCRHVLPATASCISADYLDCGSISDAAKLHLYCTVADFASIQSSALIHCCWLCRHCRSSRYRSWFSTWNPPS
jgi:hypothetical protein